LSAYRPSGGASGAREIDVDAVARKVISIIQHRIIEVIVIAALVMIGAVSTKPVIAIRRRSVVTIDSRVQVTFAVLSIVIAAV
jgi:hypothetical protein